MSNNTEASWFGDQPVDAPTKTRLVRAVFSNVAPRYDLMNDLMSGGVHRIWKARFVAGVALRPGMALVDVAAGTGDIALRLRRRARDATIILADINATMLSLARDRALDQGAWRGLGQGLAFMVANAEAMPFEDRSLDAYTIAFGLRNVTDIPAALAEANRVLKPGGRFYCLEFSRVILPLFDRFYEAYTLKALPRLGALVVHDHDSYQYLAESIRRFPDQSHLAQMLSQAGFARARYQNMSGGIAAIHTAMRV